MTELKRKGERSVDLGKLRHLNVGWAYRGHAIRLYILDDVVTFGTEDGEFIGETKIDPTRDYSPRVTASDNVHRFSCSRCPDRFHEWVSDKTR